jgi:hypothetical protein
MDENSVDTKKISTLLLKRYGDYNWLCMPELRFGTGHSFSNAIDLFVISKYAKHGYGYSIAFEIKTSRQDFMNEIKNPDKRGIFVDNSHQFYFVTPIGLLRETEIPDECGLMEIGKRITIKKIAPQRKLKGYTPCLVASILSVGKVGYDTPDTRLFKYIGKEMTEKDLEDLIKKKTFTTEESLKRDAFDRYKKEFTEKNESNYRSLVEEISKLLDITYTDGYSGSHEVYSNDRIISTIERLIERADKINFTRSELASMKTEINDIVEQIDNKLKKKRRKK